MRPSTAILLGAAAAAVLIDPQARQAILGAIAAVAKTAVVAGAKEPKAASPSGNAQVAKGGAA